LIEDLIQLLQSQGCVADTLNNIDRFSGSSSTRRTTSLNQCPLGQPTSTQTQPDWRTIDQKRVVVCSPVSASWTCLGPFRTEEFDRWLNGVNALKDFFEYTVSFSHRMICIIDSLEHLLVTSPKRSKVFQRFHFKRSCFHQLFDIYWVRVCLGEKSQTVCPVVNGSKPKVPNSW
jgi:hypothetical protein